MKKREIDWEIFTKFVADVKELNNIAIFVPVGLGEPFLYTHWKEAFQYLRLHLPTVPLRIVSNGVAVNEDVAEALCSSIFTHNDNILFSINAWDR